MGVRDLLSLRYRSSSSPPFRRLRWTAAQGLHIAGRKTFEHTFFRLNLQNHFFSRNSLEAKKSCNQKFPTKHKKNHFQSGIFHPKKSLAPQNSRLNPQKFQYSRIKKSNSSHYSSKKLLFQAKIPDLTPNFAYLVGIFPKQVQKTNLNSPTKTAFLSVKSELYVYKCFSTTTFHIISPLPNATPQCDTPQCDNLKLLS